MLLLSVPGKALWREVLQDAAHGPTFATIAVVLALMRELRPGALVRSAAILLQSFAAAVAIGVLTELIQHFEPGRTVSALDVLHDAAGAAFGLALLAMIELRKPSPGLRSTSPADGRGVKRRAPAAIAIALAAFTVLAWPPLECAMAYARRSAVFPVLNVGLQRADLYFIRGYHASIDRQTLPERFRGSDGETALRVRYATGDQLRYELFEPVPDWRDYGVLALDLTNPATTPLELTLRLLDARAQLGEQRSPQPAVGGPGAHAIDRSHRAGRRGNRARRAAD